MWAYVRSLRKWVSVLDDFSQIYFQKSKNETFNKFQEFKALVENQIGKHIRALRTNNGGEFVSHEFDDFCRESRIKRELIVPYNPQQNGVAKIKNRTICEVAKAMMCDHDLPSSLWAEATSTTVYIQNKSPRAILEDKTPEEAFPGEKLEVAHLRIFGCPMYIHVPKDKRMKMEPFGKKGTFVNYSETSKAYRIYVPSQKQIEVSKDVTFDEETTFHRSRESHIDIDIGEHEASHNVQIPAPDTQRSDIQREEPNDPMIQLIQWSKQSLQIA